MMELNRMFSKGTMRDRGIDITIKNNPDHILSPDNWEKVLAARFKKISKEEYKTYYLNLLGERWEIRKQEFLDLARKGIKEDIKLKCFCAPSEKICHAFIAAEFMNAIVRRLQNTSV